MAIINASQLQYTYSWTAVQPDDPKLTGRPDSTFLNRHEGYEVLAFLNRLCTSLAQAQRAEWLIRERLPATVRSHANVQSWLHNNWHAA